MQSDLSLLKEFEGLADPVDPRLEQWALGELAEDEVRELAADGHHDRHIGEWLEVYRPLSSEELSRVDPRGKVRVRPRRPLVSGPVLAIAASVTLVALTNVGLWWSSETSVAIRIEGPVEAVEDREVVSVRVEMSGAAPHLGLWVESDDGALIATGTALRPDGHVWRARARAGKLTSGYFGRLHLLAVAGGARCTRPETLEKARQANCRIARWPLTVGPPPVEAGVVAVEVLSGSRRGPTPTLEIPSTGKILISLKHPDGPISGNIVHHLWRRGEFGRWHRLTAPGGLPSEVEVGLKIDSRNLLPVGERRGALRIESGPGGEVHRQPGASSSKAWRSTVFQLVRRPDR